MRVFLPSPMKYLNLTPNIHFFVPVFFTYFFLFYAFCEKISETDFFSEVECDWPFSLKFEDAKNKYMIENESL